MTQTAKPLSAYPAWPVYAEDEIEAVADVLRSGKVNYWTGKHCHEFETAFADYCQSKYAIAVANGTVALELALIGLGLGAGDDVIVPCRGFIATASCVFQRGARPVLADVDPYSQNISLETILPHVTANTRAIIVVHHAGWPVDIAPIREFCTANDLFLIEDCAQAHGARYQNQPVGCFGDVAAFSFCQDKIISTGGEGGMVVTNKEELWRRMWSYKDHGKSYDAVFHRQHPPGYRWVHDDFGSNLRMTEMSAVLGLCQLAKLDDWVKRRRDNAEILATAINRLPGIHTHVPLSADKYYHAYYKFYAFVDSPADRDGLIAASLEQGVPCFVGSCANFGYEKAFRNIGLSTPPVMPVSENLSKSSLVFLLHPGCDKHTMAHIIDVVTTYSQQKRCVHV